MNKAILAGVIVFALAGSTAVYAQHRFHHDHHRFHFRMSAEDRSAFADARIAAIKAGLKMTAEQEKNWPALESAMRDFAKLRIDRAQASRDRAPPEDPIARMRDRADWLASAGAGLKRVVDAADPLYKSLDDNQKRRLSVLMRVSGRFASRDGEGSQRRFGRPFDRESWRDRDTDRGPARERGAGGNSGVEERL